MLSGDVTFALGRQLDIGPEMRAGQARRHCHRVSTIRRYQACGDGSKATRDYGATSAPEIGGADWRIQLRAITRDARVRPFSDDVGRT